MSGKGNRDSSGLRFSLGSLTAFSWRPEGFWVFQNDGADPFVPRSDRLINRFENNNYPDRTGIKDELKSDARFEEKDRIKTKDHLIKTWPPYERPVAPMFGIEATDKNQDPKDHEGKFNGKKITGTLKLKTPKDLLPHESAYPEEEKTDWFLHEPEHLVYLPEEDELVENRMQRLIQHYILEYSNALRPNAPFLAPLRGEYSPSQWIADFSQKAGAIAHESIVYPEGYRFTQDRVYKTRQFECSNGFDWWIGENLYFNSNIQTNPNDSIEDSAKIIARAVVDAWIDSPPHYANLIRWKDTKYKDLAMLDVGRAGNYFSQVFMGAPWWLQCGFCTWQGLESWQVLSWKTYENNRYGTPFEGRVYFKGTVLYEHSELIGAAIYQSTGQYYLLVFVLSSKKIKVLEAQFNPKAFKLFVHDDFTELCQHTIIDGNYYKKQSFFVSRDGEKGIGLVDLEKTGEDNRQYVVRYKNRLLSVSDSVLSSSLVYLPPDYTFSAGVITYSLQGYTESSNTVVHVDYSDSEYLLTNQLNASYKQRYTSNYPSGALITTLLIEQHRSFSYALNGSELSGASSSYDYSWYSSGIANTLPVITEANSGPTSLIFIDLRNSVYLIDNQLSIDGQTLFLPFSHLYTRQKIDGSGHYPIFPNLINNYDYYYKNLLGCSYAQYGDEWVFSAVGYQIDFQISDVYELSIEVISSTPVQYFLSSNSGITARLNALTKPFLVSVL